MALSEKIGEGGRKETFAWTENFYADEGLDEGREDWRFCFRYSLYSL